MTSKVSGRCIRDGFDIFIQIFTILLNPSNEGEMKALAWECMVPSVTSTVTYLEYDKWNELVSVAFSFPEDNPNFVSTRIKIGAQTEPTIQDFVNQCEYLINYLKATIQNNNQMFLFWWELISHNIIPFFFSHPKANEKKGLREEISILIISWLDSLLIDENMISTFTLDSVDPLLVSTTTKLLLNIKPLPDSNTIHMDSFNVMFNFLTHSFPFKIVRAYPRGSTTQVDQFQEEVATITKNFPQHLHYLMCYFDCIPMHRTSDTINVICQNDKAFHSTAIIIITLLFKLIEPMIYIAQKCKTDEEKNATHSILIPHLLVIRAVIDLIIEKKKPGNSILPFFSPLFLSQSQLTLPQNIVFYFTLIFDAKLVEPEQVKQHITDLLQLSSQLRTLSCSTAVFNILAAHYATIFAPHLLDFSTKKRHQILMRSPVFYCENMIGDKYSERIPPNTVYFFFSLESVNWDQEYAANFIKNLIDVILEIKLYEMLAVFADTLYILLSKFDILDTYVYPMLLPLLINEVCNHPTNCTELLFKILANFILNGKKKISKELYSRFFAFIIGLLKQSSSSFLKIIIEFSMQAVLDALPFSLSLIQPIYISLSKIITLQTISSNVLLPYLTVAHIICVSTDSCNDANFIQTRKASLHILHSLIGSQQINIKGKFYYFFLTLFDQLIDTNIKTLDAEILSICNEAIQNISSNDFGLCLIWLPWFYKEVTQKAPDLFKNCFDVIMPLIISGKCQAVRLRIFYNFIADFMIYCDKTDPLLPKCYEFLLKPSQNQVYDNFRYCALDFFYNNYKKTTGIYDSEVLDITIINKYYLYSYDFPTENDYSVIISSPNGSSHYHLKTDLSGHDTAKMYDISRTPISPAMGNFLKYPPLSLMSPIFLLAYQTKQTLLKSQMTRDPILGVNRSQQSFMSTNIFLIRDGQRNIEDIVMNKMTKSFYSFLKSLGVFVNQTTIEWHNLRSRIEYNIIPMQNEESKEKRIELVQKSKNSIIWCPENDSTIINNFINESSNVTIMIIPLPNKLFRILSDFSVKNDIVFLPRSTLIPSHVLPFYLQMILVYYSTLIDRQDTPADEEKKLDQPK